MKEDNWFPSHEDNDNSDKLHSGQSSGPDFSSIEDLLRQDADQTDVPPEIQARLSQSFKQPPARPWWRRLFD